MQAYEVVLNRCLKILTLKLLGKREKWIDQKVHKCALILEKGCLLIKHALFGLLSLYKTKILSSCLHLEVELMSCNLCLYAYFVTMVLIKLLVV